MKIYGFNNGNISACSSDTRFLTTRELTVKLTKELYSAKKQLTALELDMQKLAELYNTYRYDIITSVGRCCIEIDDINSIILDLQAKIKTLKETK